MTHASEQWRQIVARLFTLIRLPLQPHDPPRAPSNVRWAIDQTWAAIDRGEKLSSEGYLKLGNVTFGLDDPARALRAYAFVHLSKSAVSENTQEKYYLSLAHLNSALVSFETGNRKRALENVLLAIYNLEPATDPESRTSLAEAYLLQSTLQKRASLYQEAHASLTNALVVSRELKLTSVEARCWVQFAHLDYLDGSLAFAQEKIRKALDLLALSGNYRELVRTYYNAALLSADAGEFETAQMQTRRAKELMSQHRIDYGNGKVDLLEEELAMRQGRHQV